MVSQAPAYQSPTRVKWSSLGVVADGVTDNTAALNALPTGVIVVGDAPAGSFVKYTGQWLIKSNFYYIGEPNCRIVSYWTSGDNGAPSMFQANPSVALSNVQLFNLWLDKPDQTYTTRLIQLWVDHFKLVEWKSDSYRQLIYIRGSDHEISHALGTNGRPETGADGIRHLGNVPKVPSALPANVYIHHNNIQSGDAVYQIAQPIIGVQGNVSTDDVLLDTNTGVALSSGLFLVGLNNVDASLSNFTVNKVKIRNTNGSGFNIGGLIGASAAANAVSNIDIEDCTIGGGTGTKASVQIVSAGGGPIRGVSFSNVHLTNFEQTALATVGNISDVSFESGTIDAPTTSGSQGVVKIQDTVNFKIGSSSIVALGAGAIVVAQNDADGTMHPAVSPTITNNTITGVPNGFAAIDLRNVTGATITGNTMRKVPGATTSVGVKLATASGGNAGAVGSTITGNDLSATDTPVVCAPGQGNTVTGNAGASDCAS